MSRNVRDIKFNMRGRGARLDKEASGAVSLSYMRGFQVGYEQAVRDAKRGTLQVGNALLPHRAEPRRKRAVKAKGYAQKAWEQTVKENQW